MWQGTDPQRLITAVFNVNYSGDCGPLVLHDLAVGQSRELATFVTCPDLSWGLVDRALAFDDALSVVAVGGPDGTLRVGRIGGGLPHVLFGHEGSIIDLDFSPDSRWIASSGADGTLRLWPMPDLDKKPLHTLPHDELVAKLESLTNLRAVSDPESSTGWSIEIGPFPGWNELPTW